MVQMEAEDPSYPMPEGSVDGIFEMVISGNSFMSFPSMSYTEPGIYTYTIEQIAGLNPLCAYDPSVYHLKVSVTNAQDGSGLTAMVALRSEDADEKLQCLQTDTAHRPFHAIPTRPRLVMNPIYCCMGIWRL